MGTTQLARVRVGLWLSTCGLSIEAGLEVQGGGQRTVQVIMNRIQDATKLNQDAMCCLCTAALS